MVDSKLAVKSTWPRASLGRRWASPTPVPHGIDPLLEQALRLPPERKDKGVDHGLSITLVGVRRGFSPGSLQPQASAPDLQALHKVERYSERVGRALWQIDVKREEDPGPTFLGAHLASCLVSMCASSRSTAGLGPAR
jgi:hypothetical protein